MRPDIYRPDIQGLCAIAVLASCCFNLTRCGWLASLLEWMRFHHEMAPMANCRADRQNFFTSCLMGILFMKS